MNPAFDLRRFVSTAILAAVIMLRDTFSLEVTASVLCFILVIQVLLIPTVRLFSALAISLLLYACTAWLSYKYGHQYFDPWPTLSTVQAVTQIDVTCVLLAVLTTEVLLGAAAIDAAVRRAAATVQARITGLNTETADVILTLALLAVGIRDGLSVLSIGVGNIWATERRQYSEALLLASNHNIQVFCIAASVFLIVRIVLVKITSLPVIALASAWSPFIFVGSRKEAFITAAIAVIILLGRIKRTAIVFLTAGFLASLGLPIMKSGDPYASLHEFILPQYMHFAIAMGQVPSGLGGSFIEGAQLLLPGFLRITEVKSLGQEFDELHLTGVGIGASPFGQAALYNFFGSIYLSFLLVYMLLISLLVLTANKMPAASCTLFGLLLVYGRTDFWIMAFYASYISLLLALFMVPVARVPTSNKAKNTDAGMTSTKRF